MKANFERAKSRREAAEAEFKRLKFERDRLKADFDSAQAEHKGQGQYLIDESKDEHTKI